MGGTESGSIARAMRFSCEYEKVVVGDKQIACSWTTRFAGTTRGGVNDDPRVRNRIHRKMLVRSFLVCIGLGVAGLLPDLDHLLAAVPRSWHFTFAAIGGVVFCLGFALDLGLHYRSRRATWLKKKAKKTTDRLATTLIVVTSFQ